MKNRTIIIAATALLLASAGCSDQLPMADSMADVPDRESANWQDSVSSYSDQARRGDGIAYLKPLPAACHPSIVSWHAIVSTPTTVLKRTSRLHTTTRWPTTSSASTAQACAGSSPTMSTRQRQGVLSPTA